MIILVILLAIFVWFVTKMILTREFNEIADEKGIEFEDPSKDK